MDHGRLHWYEPDELGSEQRTVYDAITHGARGRAPRAFPMTDEAGRLEGPFNAMLVSPEVGLAVQALGAAVRFQTALSARAREIAILEVSAYHRSPFEWFAHAATGRAAGLSGAELEAIKSGAAAPSLDANEQLVRETVRRLVVERDLDDDAFARARAELGERTLVDLIALVGFYELIARSLRVCRVPLPAGVPSPFPDVPA